LRPERGGSPRPDASDSGEREEGSSDGVIKINPSKNLVLLYVNQPSAYERDENDMGSVVICKRETKQRDAWLPEEDERKGEPQTVEYEASAIEVSFSVQSDTLLMATLHTDHPTESYGTCDTWRLRTNCRNRVSLPLRGIRIPEDHK
jgi:uncharacterized protein YhdP